MAEAFAVKKNVKFLGYSNKPISIEREFQRVLEMSPEGLTFNNGDRYAGSASLEDGCIWFVALDKDGNEYETAEYPCLRIGGKR